MTYKTFFLSIYHQMYLLKFFTSFNSQYGLLISHNFHLNSIFCNKYLLNYSILTILKNHLFLQYNQFIDLIAIDRLFTNNFRFRLVYILKNIKTNLYFTIQFFINESNFIPSLVVLFSGLNWAEREVWDLFGLFFNNHPDLRRILTDYGFKGYPLRKDFPLTGFKELFYNEYLKLLKYKNISLMQEFRFYAHKNPWGSSLNYFKF